MVFDVYLGTISNPPLVATGLLIDEYNLEGNSYCVDNLPENCDKYGRYYNTWLPDTNVCPKGWFYPSKVNGEISNLIWA